MENNEIMNNNEEVIETTTEEIVKAASNGGNNYRIGYDCRCINLQIRSRSGSSKIQELA